jgi:hypothetical protein
VPTLIFHPATKTIRVPAPAVEVTVQELVDQIADYLDEPQNLDITWFAEWAGKVSLGGTPEVFSEVVLILIDDWRVEFEPRAGPDYVSCVVRGGTFVAANTFADNPIKPSAYTQVQIRQSISGSLLDAEEMRKILHNKTVTDPDTGEMTIYDDDDVTPFLTAPIYEDKDGAVPYRRDGIERRERFTKP